MTPQETSVSPPEAREDHHKCKLIHGCVESGRTRCTEHTKVPREASETSVARKLFVQTAQDVPTSRCERGKTSAEYVEATGLLPGE